MQIIMDDGSVLPDVAYLTSAQLGRPFPEAAYHRTVDRITHMAALGDPLIRWAMGTRNHQ